MKNSLILFLSCIFALAFVCSCKQSTPNTSTQPDTTKHRDLAVYDTAMWMLKEFVAEAGDSSLGFKNAEEAGRARIAVDEGVHMAILGLGKKLDSAGAGDRLQDSLHMEMTKLNRVVYPVYLDSELRAGITFDTTWCGWRPVIFDDAGIFGEINGYFRKLSPTERKKGKHLLVMAPPVHDHLYLVTDSTGDHVIVGGGVKTTMAENFPASADSLKVDKDKFLAGLQRHIAKKEKERAKRR